MYSTQVNIFSYIPPLQQKPWLYWLEHRCVLSLMSSTCYLYYVTFNGKFTYSYFKEADSRIIDYVEYEFVP